MTVVVLVLAMTAKHDHTEALLGVATNAAHSAAQITDANARAKVTPNTIIVMVEKR